MEAVVVGPIEEFTLLLRPLFRGLVVLGLAPPDSHCLQTKAPSRMPHLNSHLTPSTLTSGLATATSLATSRLALYSLPGTVSHPRGIPPHHIHFR